MSTLRVGVIGLGIGVQHLRVYQGLKDVKIAAVGDILPTAAELHAKTYGAKAYTDAVQMLEKEKLDAVSICTPPRSHRELTQAAARAGTHVLCEKPMAPSVPDCDAMVEACARAGVRLMIAQKKRFHPLIQRIKALSETQFGPVRWAVCKYALGKVNKGWFWQEEDGGGPLLENSIHTVDMLRFLMGEVVRVYAEGDNLFMPSFKPQLDVATYTFRFANGSMAAIGSGMASEWAFANEHFYFALDGAEIRLHGSFDRPEHWWLGRRDKPGEPEQEHVPNVDTFILEIEHFLKCVRTGEKPLVTGEDGRGSVAACLAVKESARTGKPVRLDLK
jgi:predicted dehydrogenase